MARERSGRVYFAVRSASSFIWIYARMRRHSFYIVQIHNPINLNPGSQMRLPGIFSYKNHYHEAKNQTSRTSPRIRPTFCQGKGNSLCPDTRTNQYSPQES